MSLTRSSAILVAAVFAAACGEDPVGPGNNNNNNQNNRVVVANPSFATHINEIFQRRGCSGGNCHGSATGRAGLRLTADAAANYGQLVNIPATSETFMRILPNNPDSSYVMIKVTGQQTVGAQMPLNGAALDTIDINNLTNWINNGAPNN